MRPRAADIDIGPLLSVIVGHHKLADHASMVVEEDVAVEEPAAKPTTQRCAVNELTIIESNFERERVIGWHIDAVSELAISSREGRVGWTCERDWLHREAVQMEGMVRLGHVRDRQLQDAAYCCGCVTR